MSKLVSIPIIIISFIAGIIFLHAFKPKNMLYPSRSVIDNSLYKNVGINKNSGCYQLKIKEINNIGKNKEFCKNALDVNN
tara:strand:+ start:150 stop:389 length:240 start_codon:yes stop_codon:yes gene_type:complete